LVVSLDDRLEPNHLVRSVRALTEEVLGLRLRSNTNLVGGFSYDPVDLLSVWLYGFMLGILSSRRLEEACRYDIRFEFLCRSCRPDHTTLSRFRGSLGKELDALMLDVLTEADRRGVLSRKTMAMDGTKISARRTQWLRKVVSEADQEQTLEDEAQTMLNHGQYLVGYNVQTAADTESGLIVGYVVTSSPSDGTQAPCVLEAVAKHSGALSEQVVADKGYDTAGNALALKQAGVTAFIPRAMPRSRQSIFTARADGRFECPAGHVAREDTNLNRHGRLYLRYRVSKCPTCPLQGSCAGKGKERAIYVPADEAGSARMAANARCQGEEGQRVLRLRGPTIELTFAHIKGEFGLRRFKLAGRERASLEFGLAALAYNTRRLIRLHLRPKLPKLAPFANPFGNRCVA
jgi:transposase